MGEYSNTFDWLQFPEGRARFSSGIRGWDEKGYETFAVEVDCVEYFGEVKRSFLPNNNDFNIEIASFGYGTREDVGMPMSGATSQAFTSEQIETVQSLIRQLVMTGLSFESRPTVLTEYSDARFMGEFIFRDGWARERSSEVSSFLTSSCA